MSLGGPAAARVASRLTQEVLQQFIPLPLVSQLAQVSGQLGQRELRERGITQVPTAIEFLGVGPLGAVTLDVFGIGEQVSEGDVVRLRQRLDACTAQLGREGHPLDLGILRGDDLNTINDALVHAQKRRTTDKARRAIVQADAIVRAAGYSGLLDPRLKQPGGRGGPAFKKLQRTLASVEA